MLMFARRSLTLSAGFLALIVGLGCSKSGDFGTVTGTVTFNGTPVDDAKVEFHGTTESEGARDLVTPRTDSSGKYMIAGVGKNPGIPPGMYKVVITKYNVKDEALIPKEGFDAGQIDAMMSDTGITAKSAVRNLLPKEYSSAATTKLSVTVEAGKNEGKDFALTGTAGGTGKK